VKSPATTNHETRKSPPGPGTARGSAPNCLRPRFRLRRALDGRGPAHASSTARRCVRESTSGASSCWWQRGPQRSVWRRFFPWVKAACARSLREDDAPRLVHERARRAFLLVDPRIRKMRIGGGVRRITLPDQSPCLPTGGTFPRPSAPSISTLDADPRLAQRCARIVTPRV